MSSQNLVNQGVSAQTNGNDRGKPENRRKPRQRDVQRVAEHKQARHRQDDSNWNENTADEAKFADLPQPAQTSSRRGKAPPRKSSDWKNSTPDSPQHDEVLYDGIGSGSRPVRLQAAHNLDQAGYSELIFSTYSQITSVDKSMARVIPFCMWQHAYVELLWAYIMHQMKTRNSDPRLARETDPLTLGNFDEIWVPQAIADYIRGFCHTTTPAGEDIALNIPDAAFPQGPLAATDDPVMDGMDSGSFGTCDAESHGAYEAYFSPYVTRRAIEMTLEYHDAPLPAGATARARREQHLARLTSWNPLPTGRFPHNAIANDNLLGHRTLEAVRPDGANELRRCQFQSDDTALGRLAHCPYALEKVSAYVHATKVLKVVQVRDIKYCTSDATLVISELDLELPATSALYTRLATLHSPYAFGSATSNKANYFSYKRLRAEEAPGLCYLLADLPIDGWEATRNDNYEMAHDFAPFSFYVDRPILRSLDHREDQPASSTQQVVTQWLSRHCVLQRDRRL